MRRTGPPPKPTALKKLAGNPGKRPLNESEPHFPIPRRLPSPPDFLSQDAADIWRRLGKLLLGARLLTVVDTHALAMFCAVTARWIEAEKKIIASGPVLAAKDTGNLYHNPYLSVANKAWEQMRKMLGEFGLTPAERSRLRTMVMEDEPSLAEQLFAMAGVDAEVEDD